MYCRTSATGTQALWKFDSHPSMSRLTRNPEKEHPTSGSLAQFCLFQIVRRHRQGLFSTFHGFALLPSALLTCTRGRTLKDLEIENSMEDVGWSSSSRSQTAFVENS